jgi:hypothetical protein
VLAAAREYRAILGSMVIADERNGPLTNERANDPQRLLEAVHAVIEREPEGRVLGLMPTAPKTQDQASVADGVQRGGHLGEDRRAAEARGQHDRPELYALGRHGDGAQQRPRFVDPARRAVETEEKVIVDPDRIRPARLRLPGKVADLRP